MITFTVPGPAVGKARPRAARRGKYIAMYTPDKTARYENLVSLAASQAMAGREMFTGAVAVGLDILVTPPASWPQKKRRQALDGDIFPTSKPDIDNIIKGLFDAMNGIVFVDDKQVVNVAAFKSYSLDPCVRISVQNAK